jgi:hypothetical protein
MLRYSATVELDDRSSDQLASQLLDLLADYQPAVGSTEAGRQEVVLTIPAETLRQAVTTTLAIVAAAGRDAHALHVLPTTELDRPLEL